MRGLARSRGGGADTRLQLFGELEGGGDWHRVFAFWYYKGNTRRGRVNPVANFADAMLLGE